MEKILVIILIIGFFVFMNYAILTSERGDLVANLFGNIIYLVVIIAVIIAVIRLFSNVSKTRENTGKQLEILQRQENSKTSHNVICPCCENIVSAESLKQLQSKQLICQKCYNEFNNKTKEAASK
jgi:uncharacterized CHY-type Zn-finger protein